MARKNDYNYFDAFVTYSEYACRAAEYLHETFSKFDPHTFSARMTSMHSIENEADRKKHEMNEHLAREFIAPIEREDIMALAQELDNVTDSIDDVMRWMYMSNITELRTGALEFSKLIVASCSAMKNCMEEFRHFKKSKAIHSLIVEVNNLESDGDHLHADCVRDLFTLSEQSSLHAIAWLNMYDKLEACLDACEHVCDIVESVIMKNT